MIAHDDADPREELDAVEVDDLDVEASKGQDQDDGEARQKDAPDLEAAIRETQEEARKYGWRPRDQFTLNPETWVDADRFLELGSTQRKMLKDALAQRDQRIEEQERKLEAIAALNRQTVERQVAQERQRFEQQLAALREHKRQAAEEADLARYDELDRQERQMRPPQVEGHRDQPQEFPEVKAYREANAWTQSADLWDAAVAAVAANPAIQSEPPARQLRYAEMAVRQAYPEAFAQPAPRQQAAQPRQARVDGGGLGASSRGKGAESLPADVKAIARSEIENGHFANMDEYAKEYFAHLEGRA